MLLTAMQESLADVVRQWRDGDGDAFAAGLGTEVEARMATIGREVRVLVPGGKEVRGAAAGLGADGSLVVELVDGERCEVRSGDVSHVRTVGSA